MLNSKSKDKVGAEEKRNKTASADSIVTEMIEVIFASNNLWYPCSVAAQTRH